MLLDVLHGKLPEYYFLSNAYSIFNDTITSKNDV